MSIKLVVFDMAGTTVEDDHVVSKTFQTALSRHGYEISITNIDPLMGYEKNTAIRMIIANHFPGAPSPPGEKIHLIHQEFIGLMIRYYQSETALKALPNVEHTFRELHRQGIRVALNTGFSKDIAQVIVDRLAWQKEGLIDALIGSDEVQLGRPHAFMIHELMRLFGITDPLEIVKVGDTEVDIREGQNAGCRYVIGVTTGTFSRKELEEYHPTHVIDDISDLLQIIK